MRLAYIDPQSYHGLAKYDAGYLQGLCDADFGGQIRFYCSDLLDQAVPDQIEVQPVFNYNRRRFRLTKLTHYFIALLRLSADVFRRPVDVCHFQWLKFPLIDLLFVFSLRKLAGVQIVLTAHNVVPHGQENGRHWSLGKLSSAVDRIVVHNSSTAAEIARRFSIAPSKFSVLRHGATNLEARGTRRYKEEVERFAAGCDTCFMFFGRGSRYKGLDILLNAWPRVRSTSLKPGLIVMGALDDDLKALAKGAAKEAGNSILVVDDYVAEADLFHAVSQSDVVVLPHRSISHSGALSSALGLRVPILVSPLPGLLEPLAIAEVGWTFDGSEQGLVSRLMFLAEHPELVSRARSNDRGWEAIRQAYDWTSIAREGIDLYADLMALR
jgi:D-inositol-3-phosphate glycosyltransferase